MSKPLPIVSIVGRPNVGKSSLFNRIAGRKAAVVDDVAGVTRDRNYTEASYNGFDFLLADTGGLIPGSTDRLVESVRGQVDAAIDESRVIVFCVEAGTGPTDLDLQIARRLRRQCHGKVVAAVNKAESPAVANDAARYLALGFGEPAVISALHGTGMASLLDRICKILAAPSPPRLAGGTAVDLSIAVIGRPNAGKSLLVNRLLKKERMIVDPAAGTTRDAVDSFLAYHGKTVRLIDTAGLRRKSQVRQKLEYYTNLRALDSIGRADVCVLMIDIADGVATQDLKILNTVFDAHKGAVVCFNKWDLVEKDHKTFDMLAARARRRYMEMRRVVMLSISALTGLRVGQVIDTAFGIRERMRRRIEPSLFRERLFDWVRTRPHPVAGTRTVRVLGGKQLAGDSPHFLLFCTNPALVQASYVRYLINRISDEFDFAGCPISLSFKPPGKSRRGRAGGRHEREDKEL